MFQSTGKCEKLRKKKDERKKKKQVQANNYINLYFGNATQEFLSISNVLRKQLIWNGKVPRKIEKKKGRRAKSPTES